ncbi:hypothetical protein SAMN02746064_02223 [Alkalibacter saccharofermentans DSM 14828]|uniref:Uncharacterized protein n=1 Tax=Alkalibacter saccharofermentans DSM 14828 TaxID=1120975 RepID=A0A1M5A480_9FIRM|nr:hypothetical protein SAMN02746064_02223 [Alkalibacter saccharofermentans DSM 14828]
MIYSHEVENMCSVAKGPKHGPAAIPEEGKWVKAKVDCRLVQAWKTLARG